MSSESGDESAREAAVLRAIASKHDRTSRTTKVCAGRTKGHPVDGGLEWCFDELCPINRAAEELRLLRIQPGDMR